MSDGPLDGPGAYGTRQEMVAALDLGIADTRALDEIAAIMRSPRTPTAEGKYRRIQQIVRETGRPTDDARRPA